MTHRRARFAFSCRTAFRSRRDLSFWRPAMSCPRLFIPPSRQFHRVGLLRPSLSWKDGVLIWEDGKDYLYARTTASLRIIIGGEDSEDVIEREPRDRLIPEKARLLTNRLTALWPTAKTDIEFRWAGTFVTTRDGLPLIGRVPGMKGVYAAYGYGGNGITFSFLAAQLIGGLIAGTNSQLLIDFALDRDGGPMPT
jgi:glycine/D-amino acid oxidase-like deaminating enzyme